MYDVSDYVVIMHGNTKVLGSKLERRDIQEKLMEYEI